MSAAAADAARRLLATSEALILAIHDGDADVLGAALEARIEAFEALEAVASERPEGVRALVERVQRLDVKALAAARCASDEVRGELERMAAARRVARTLRAPKQAPRFIARRV